jgi:hypothetical protein
MTKRGSIYSREKEPLLTVQQLACGRRRDSVSLLAATKLDHGVEELFPAMVIAVEMDEVSSVRELVAPLHVRVHSRLTYFVFWATVSLNLRLSAFICG